jgi:SAM-dependent methyltransferase
LAELYPEYPCGKEHRKSWEYQQIIRGAAHAGVLHEDAEVLCFPAGHERTVYEMSNRARRVYACDVYGSTDNNQVSCDPFLIDPAAFARQPWKPTRLFPRHMDALFIRFDAESFDLAVCPAFSAYPIAGDSAGNLLLEFERVLRPGGVAVLSVEFILAGPGAVNIGSELYDIPALLKMLSTSHNLMLMEDIQTTVSEATHATAMPLATAKDDAQRGTSRFPHVVLEADGRQFTTATVFLRKVR